MNSVSFADYVDGVEVRTGKSAFAGDNADAAFAASAFNAGYTEAGDRAGCISRKTVDGRGERVLVTAHVGNTVRDTLAAYRRLPAVLLGAGVRAARA